MPLYYATTSTALFALQRDGVRVADEWVAGRPGIFVWTDSGEAASWALEQYGDDGIVMPLDPRYIRALNRPHSPHVVGHDLPPAALGFRAGGRTVVGGRTVAGAPQKGSVWTWLPPSLVYPLEPVAADRDLSRVARQRPRQGGWADAAEGTPTKGAIKKAIRRAEGEVGAPFYLWSYSSHGREVEGVSWRKNPFVDDGDKRRKGWYGFMAFYDWMEAHKVDVNRLLNSDGKPATEAIADRSGSFDDPERWAEWATDWLKWRRGFIARTAKQAGSGWEDGEPNNDHLTLVMWASSPTPSRLREWL